MLKVAISYRVLPAYRVPVFERLAARDNIQLCVFYGDDFKESKVKSHVGRVSFQSKKLKTIRLKIRTRNGLGYFSIFPGLWPALKKFDPDIIITEGASNVHGNIVSFLYARFYKKKLVQWGLGRLQGRTRSRWRRVVDTFFIPIERNSDAAITYSSLGVEYYRSIGMPIENIYKAVNVINTEQRIMDMQAYCINSDLTYPSPVPTTFSILFVGALAENKNVGLLLRVFAKLRDSCPDVLLTIVGDGPLMGQLTELATELKISNSVNFAGHTSDNIAQYFWQASILVMPGLGGLVISDALCQGVPVICGIGDGCERDLVDGTNGIIIERMTEDSLLLALRELVADPERQAAWRRSAIKIIEENYNIENYVNILEACILDVSTR